MLTNDISNFAVIGIPLFLEIQQQVDLSSTDLSDLCQRRNTLVLPGRIKRRPSIQLLQLSQRQLICRTGTISGAI